ncbi:MAG TPA: cobalamin-dependent protein, partial [Candidatus Limnocylindrales bacterium]|nr:cobalamin-dependent protein [Candidatus Limnocylindrales bacterium]
ALQEDVDVVGLSILSGAHLALVPRVREALDANGLQDVYLIVGGIIPEQDYEPLRALGVAGIFGPGTTTNSIAVFINSLLTETPTA